MKNILKKLPSVLIAFVLLVGTVSVMSHFAQASNYPITGQNFYLSGAGVTSSQTTVPLTSLKTPDGRVITMAMVGTTGYGTLEPQSPAKTEIITFTGITQNGNGTATLTGVTRGIDFAYPYAASTAYRQAHAGGATFIISNTPNWYYDNFPIQGDDNVTVWPAASTSVATRGYVDYVAFNGASVINATTLAKGISQLATGLQAASTTALGSSGASLALTSSISTSTYNAATAPLKVVVTNNSGFIDSGFVNALATTTTVGYLPAFQIALQRQVFSTPGTSTFSVPAGITKVNVQVLAAGAAGAGSGVCSSQANGGAGGYAGGYSNKNVDVTGTSTIQVFVGTGGTGVANASGNPGTWSTFGTNGFYASSTPGTASAAGVGMGGDFNITGGGPGGGFTTTLSTVTAKGGAGGSSYFGAGGATDSGNAGNYGGGGGGATCINTASSQAGGTGGNGLVIVGW